MCTEAANLIEKGFDEMANNNLYFTKKHKHLPKSDTLKQLEDNQRDNEMREENGYGADSYGDGWYTGA